METARDLCGWGVGMSPIPIRDVNNRTSCIWEKSFELSEESKHKLGGMRASQLFQKAVVRCRVRDTGYEDKFTFRFGKTLVETR